MTFSIQNYTTYSIFSGVKEPKEWVKYAKELGYSSLAISDKQTMAGHVEFQNSCDEHGIKSILGVEFLVVDDIKVRDGDKVDGVILLYAKDEVGYRNLIQLNNLSQQRGEGKPFYYRPRVDVDMIIEYAEGVVAVIPPESGYGFKLEANKKEFKGLEKIHKLWKTFEDDLYLGVNPNSEDKYITIAHIVDSLPYQKVYTFNAHVPTDSEEYLYDVIRKLDNGATKKHYPRDVNKPFMPTLDAINASESLLAFASNKPFSDELHSKCLNGLEEFEKKCNHRIELGVYHMPHVDPVFKDTIEEDIMHLIGEGFKKKLCPTATFESLKSFDELYEYADELPFEHTNKGEGPPYYDEDGKEIEVKITLKPLSTYIDKLKYEFKIINDLNYLGYFHLIWEITDYCDRIGEERGFARGSAAGSLFSYLLNITRIDPIRHDLVFERFLNPDRNDLPDIDLDFSHIARAKVKQYLIDKYGEDRVISVGTYDRLKVVSAIKKVGEAYSWSIPLEKANEDDTTKYYQYDFQAINLIVGKKFVKATARGEEELKYLREYEIFEKFYLKHKTWFDEYIMPLQETITTRGVHAAGLLITPTDYNELLPAWSHSKTDSMVTQWRDRFCESRGFPKFDLLTVEGIDVISHAKALIFKMHGVVIPEWEDIPLNDKLALTLFAKVDTEGIFQFKTPSQKRFLNKFTVTQFEHLVASVSLIRPGPMEMGSHNKFAKILKGLSKPSYEHEDLVSVLGETYGLLVYQEQMMDVVRVIGGLTNSQADHVRKACGKKKLKDMAKWEKVFKEGAVENGYGQELADSLWEQIVPFAEYSFNKSHAVAYCALSYYQAWIKARYPLEYWCSVLTFASDDVKKANSVYRVKEVAEQNGIEFVYPTIYGFATGFEPAGGNKIYWPITEISKIGPTASRHLEEAGKFSYESFEEFYDTYDKGVFKKDVYVNMIKAGFFEPLHEPWEAVEMLYYLRAVAKSNKLKKKPDPIEVMEDIPFELATQDKFKWLKMRNKAFKTIVASWKTQAPFHHKVKPIYVDNFKKRPDDKVVFIGGYIERLQIKQTKAGKWYARATVVDKGERFAVNFWNSYWNNVQLDIDGIRPRKGQLIELIGEKSTWHPPNSTGDGWSSISVNKSNYVKIVWNTEGN